MGWDLMVGFWVGGAGVVVGWIRGRKEGSKEGRKQARKKARKQARKEGRKEARKEGRKQGSKEARKEGRKEGSKEGRKEARKEARKEILQISFHTGTSANVGLLPPPEKRLTKLTLFSEFTEGQSLCWCKDQSEKKLICNLLLRFLD